jgi:hypothetical protein
MECQEKINSGVPDSNKIEMEKTASEQHLSKLDFPIF